MDLLLIKKYMISDPLQAIGLGTDQGINQVFYTGYVESKYETVYQMHGPAKSFFQIESPTHLTVKNKLTNGLNGGLCERVLHYCSLKELPPDEMLIIDQRYAAIICRLIYYFNPAPLPKTKDAMQIANAHKLIYNTKYGKADPMVNSHIIQNLIDEGF